MTRDIRSHVSTDPSTLPIACSLNDGDLAARSAFVRGELFAGVVERQELDDGYAFRFPGDGDWPVNVAEFVAAERQCCSFFRFVLTFEPGLGPIWMTLTGPEGTKQFIEATFEELGGVRG
jgi:hypothetical protein